MEEIIKAFGIDSKLIIIQIVNFGILLVALWYFLYTPILKVLNEREEKIRNGIIDAEDAAKLKENAEGEKAAVLKRAHADGEEIVTKAKLVAEEKGGEVLREASKKSDQIVEDAKKKAEEFKLRAEKESEAEVAKAAVLAAEKILLKEST